MKNIPTRSKAAVWVGTLLGTLFCILIAFAVDAPTFADMTQEQLGRELVIHILVPIGLAGPLLFALLHNNRALTVAYDEMSKMAKTDSLTGVLNRGAFTMTVEAYLEHAAQAAPIARGSLLLIDVDHFKSINDDFGHDGGDEALRQISRTMRSAVRPSDLVGRIGGEEFAIFLPLADPPQAELIAERIRKHVGAIAFPSAEQRLLSVSIGGVNFRKGASFDRLFKAADRCLYLAKHCGRNRVDMVDYMGSAA